MILGGLRGIYRAHRLLRTYRSRNALSSCEFRVSKQVRRWMRDELVDRFPENQHAHLFRQWCQRYRRGEPLQYIIGNQPFGELSILCKPNVLIPRWETEEYTLKLAKVLNEVELAPKRILDIGTGSGCIALLLSAEMKPQSAFIQGIDISHHAIQLCEVNKARNALLLRNEVTFHIGDMMDAESMRSELLDVDVVVSNPPYISIHASLPRSVNEYEPSLALRGHGENGDGYLDVIVDLLKNYSTSVKLVVLEVGDSDQAVRIMNKFQTIEHCTPHAWKDGAGKCRAVLATFKSRANEDWDRSVSNVFGSCRVELAM